MEALRIQQAAAKELALRLDRAILLVAEIDELRDRLVSIPFSLWTLH
jgi:hypothetical protein